MPRNKRPQDREEKRDEIITAARRLFVEDGYDATSMSRLAATAGIAPNTVYWYFRDKDDVLLAVLEAVVTDSWQEYSTMPAEGITDRILWLIEQFEQLDKLVSTVHSRILASEAINNWHNQFHALTEAVLRHELHSADNPDTDMDAVVKIWTFTIEGLLMHPADPVQKRAICETLARLGSSVG